MNPKLKLIDGLEKYVNDNKNKKSDINILTSKNFEFELIDNDFAFKNIKRLEPELNWSKYKHIWVSENYNILIRYKNRVLEYPEKALIGCINDELVHTYFKIKNSTIGNSLPKWYIHGEKIDTKFFLEYVVKHLSPIPKEQATLFSIEKGNIYVEGRIKKTKLTFFD